MLSKEEISKLKINVFNQCDDETIRLVAEMLKHTEQLESNKQKLIELLEKANKEDTNTVKYYEKQRRLTTDDFYKKSYQTQIHKANSRREVRKNILEIVKGENQVTVK